MDGGRCDDTTGWNAVIGRIHVQLEPRPTVGVPLHPHCTLWEDRPTCH